MTSISLTTILPHLLHEFRDERDLVNAIMDLSKGFTTDRGAIKNYLSNERLSSAYAAFYLLTNIPKFAEVMKWMPDGWKSELKTTTFIDVGAGPGTYSIAWKTWLESAAVNVVQIETSEVMRRQAQKLWRGLYPDEPLQGTYDKAKPRLLFFGHSANEMGADTAIRYIRDIDPEHVLFIEPGTKEYFPTMLKIREYLLNRNYHVLYPCPTAATCPMAGSEDWCHQFLKVRQDPEIERISQMARKDRRNLPIITQAYSRTFKSTNPEARIVRVLPETKFSYEWQVCENNVLQNYQVQKRGLERIAINEFSEVLAGSSVEAEIEKILPESKRVKIKKLN